MATFDAKFSGMAPRSEEVPLPAGGRGLGAGPPPTAGQVVNQQDYTLMGAWEELWESNLHERKYCTCALYLDACPPA